MSFINQTAVSVYSQNAGITQISKGAYFSASAPGTNTLNGPYGPFRLGNFIITAAGGLYYLQSISTVAGVTSATWTLLATSSSSGIIPVSEGGTGVGTLTGIPLGSGTSPFTSLTFTTPTAWIPNLQINGSSTGITYTTDVGLYTQVGPLVCFTMNIILSSKGVGTGNVTISNMPVTSGANGAQNTFKVLTATVTLTANYTDVLLTLGNASAVAQFFQAGSAQAYTPLTDAQLANTSSIQMTGTYLIG